MSRIQIRIVDFGYVDPDGYLKNRNPNQDATKIYSWLDPELQKITTRIRNTV